METDSKATRLMRQASLMHQAPRCGARTRKGTPCQGAAVKGKRRCRMHGGAKGIGAPTGEANGSYRHGRRTKEHMAEMRIARLILAEARSLLAEI